MQNTSALNPPMPPSPLDAWDPPPPSLPPSSATASRWARIPFDILHDCESRSNPKRPRLSVSRTCISDIPEPILAVIFSLILDPRTRNSMALVCTDWYSFERATRLSLTLRGNINDLYLIPRSFQAVEYLDLSRCSPWGHSLFQSSPERALLIGHLLKQAFPRVKNMTVYARVSRDIEMVACIWPELLSLKLVRWHQRPTSPVEASGLGMEFNYLMQSCKSLMHLDLSQFYCWTEDIPPALAVEPSVSENLRSLNLLKVSVEGFKASEFAVIINSCKNLEDLRIVLVFDPCFLDFVGDPVLLQLGNTCKKLKVLHLIDSSAVDDVRAELEEGFTEQDVQITSQGLMCIFQALPLLEELEFVLSQNMRDAGPALEVLASHCKRLNSLKLGHFHGLCRGPQPDGIALCRGLNQLMIKNCADLNDIGMVGIASGCSGLRKLGLQSCKEVSMFGLLAVTGKLSGSLIDICISCCLQITTADVLWALQPIQGTIQHLHLDCLIDNNITDRDMEEHYRMKVCSFTNVLPTVGNNGCFIGSHESNNLDGEYGCKGGGLSGGLGGIDLNCSVFDAEANTTEHAISDNLKACTAGHAASGNLKGISEDLLTTSSRLHSRLVCGEITPDDGLVVAGLNGESSSGCGGLLFPKFSLAFRDKAWSELKSLSLWIPLGELLSPLPAMGLKFCPSLHQIRLKVEGDSRLCLKPKTRVCYISTLSSYPMLSKLTLDCSDIVGYALSAPAGHMELSLWERWYLQGIDRLKLWELDYWPPQDRDANRRGLSLPAAGLISQCTMLRKLTLHGTINEHLLRLFLNSPNLRDVQLRIDYYPAPDVDSNTEMRPEACQRFEVALAERGFPD